MINFSQTSIQSLRYFYQLTQNLQIIPHFSGRQLKHTLEALLFHTLQQKKKTVREAETPRVRTKYYH